MSTLKIEFVEKENLFCLIGRFDESADFTPIMDRKLAMMRLDFKGLKRVNSFGIKNWIAFSNNIEGSKIVLMNCPVFIVEQMIMLPEFQGNADVESFFLPFFCSRCGEEVERLIQVAAISKEGSEFLDTLCSDYSCPKCQNVLEFDDDLEIYRKFIINL